MSKALWAALPIAVFFAIAAALALAKRPLSRPALNVMSSLLLLAYVAITAGLGVFWVANQQLPAFDWHYLFGYGTVALLLVHLAFNLRLLLAFFRRRARSGAAARTAGETRPREEPGGARPRLGWVALALTGMFLTFALGVRHGRVEISVASGSALNTDAWAAAVEQYHEVSSHSMLGILRRAPSVDWGDAPPPKTYPGAPRTPLLVPGAPGRGRSVSHAMRGPGSSRTDPLDLAALASILHHTSGVTHVRGGLAMRAAPSSGALFPAEVYVVARGAGAGAATAPPLAAGLYHFDPLDPALERLADEPSAAQLGVDAASLHDAPAVVIVTAVLRRTGQKYRDRAYRYAAADIGHLMENVAIAAAEHGLSADPLPAFDDAAAAEALGVDGALEAVLAILPLTPRAGPPVHGARSRAYAPVDLPPSATLGVTGIVHAATSLRRLPPRAADELAAAGTAHLLPAPAPAPGTALGAIADRESRRTYSPSPIPLDHLSSLLSNATAVAPRLSTAVSVHLVANRVEGVAPGAHLFVEQPPSLTQVRPGDLRKEAFSAALSQDVIGGAAAVVVLAIDEGRVRAEGPRGYRHALLEIGMLGERILLEATARGLGNCPVGAFHDEDAAALIGVDPARTWVAHFIGLGVLPP